MNSRGPNGSWSFSLVGHWAEPQWGQRVLGAVVRCQLFIVASAKGIYWFQINFYCMQSSQHEMLHCHSSVTDNPLQSPTGETAATTWTFPFKITLEEKCPDCELRLEELKEPFPAVGGGTALQGEWQCSCTFCSWLEQNWGEAEPSPGVVLCSSQWLLQEGGECVLACSLQKTLSERKKKKKTQKRRSKNEQLYHYLMCWDLGRDQLKDPYCLQQLMSLTSAEAVLSLKVLTYLQFSVLSLALICHFKMNAPFVQPNHLHEHSTSSKSQICFAFPPAAILYFGNRLMQQSWKKKFNLFLFKGISLAVMSPEWRERY